MRPAVALLLSLLGCALPAAAGAADAGNLKVFLIVGQSNTEGQAEVATKNATTGEYLNGTLAYQLRDPRTAAFFAPLWNNATGRWSVLDNVKVWFNEASSSQQGVNGSVIPSKPGDAAFGPLTVGFGCNADPNLIGPELGFGFGMNAALGGAEPFVVMKMGWGGKSLAGDFRPPSSVANFDVFCQGACPNVVGHFYNVVVADVHAMLAPGAIAAQFPDLAGYTPKLAGLGWFQGCESRRSRLALFPRPLCASPLARSANLALALAFPRASAPCVRRERRLRPERDCGVRAKPGEPHRRPSH